MWIGMCAVLWRRRDRGTEADVEERKPSIKEEKLLL